VWTGLVEDMFVDKFAVLSCSLFLSSQNVVCLELFFLGVPLTL